MLCVIWYYLYNLNNVENTHGEVILSVKLKVLACIFTKSFTTPWVFFTLFKLHKWYKIAQSIENMAKMILGKLFKPKNMPRGKRYTFDTCLDLKHIFKKNLPRKELPKICLKFRE